MEAFGVNGGDGMIIFYEYLINEALRIVDLKGTVDDIKAGNDLKEINRIISNKTTALLAGRLFLILRCSRPYCPSMYAG